MFPDFPLIPGTAILLVLVNFIIVVVFLALLWRISYCLDLVSRSLSDIARDIKKLADKNDK